MKNGAYFAQADEVALDSGVVKSKHFEHCFSAYAQYRCLFKVSCGTTSDRESKADEYLKLSMLAQTSLKTIW